MSGIDSMPDPAIDLLLLTIAIVKKNVTLRHQVCQEPEQQDRN